MANARIDVSVVVGRRPELVFQCLRTFFDVAVGPSVVLCRVTVVVNSGSQMLAEEIRREFGSVRVVVNEAPRGFATNHNLALRNDDAPYVLMLNDDLIFLENSLLPLLQFMDDSKHDRVACVSPRLRNPDMTLQPSTYSFPTILHSIAVCCGFRRKMPPWLVRIVVRTLFARKGSTRRWAHDEQCEVESFRGACLLYRRNALEDVGWMDECALVGGEETELHFRLLKAGWRNVFLPIADVVHLGGQTVSGDPYLEIEYIKGHLNIARKHRSRFGFEILRSAVAVHFLTQLAVSTLSGNAPRRSTALHALRCLREYDYRSERWLLPARPRVDQA